MCYLEQKLLENHEIYYIEPTEQHFTFAYGAHLLDAEPLVQAREGYKEWVK